MLDRGFDLFDRLAARAGGIPEPVLFGVHQVRQGIDRARLGAARLQANAARAIAAGLGSKPAGAPPALYAFDPDIGRLAVTTPTYNAAIVAVNQRAFPYGGVELARLFDGDQEVAASVGGRPPASFGVLVRDPAGRRVAATQLGRAAVDHARTPVRLTKAPAGAGATASARVGRAFAGPFTELRATGTTAHGPLRIRTTHRFTPRFIETRWRVRGGGRRHSVDALFPSTGRGARVTAVLRGGRRVPVRSHRAVADVDYFHIAGEHAGYIVKPLTRPTGATAHTLKVAPQPSAPRPGPTLAIRLAGAARAGLTVRVTTSRQQ